MKKEYHEFAEQKKGLLFEKVTELLEEYRKTDAYKESLVRAIGKAKKICTGRDRDYLSEPDRGGVEGRA